MVSFNIRQLKSIEWIANSKFISSLDDEDEDENIELPDFIKYIPDILEDEDIIDVYLTVDFFGNEPSNYLEYLATRSKEDYDRLYAHIGDRKIGNMDELNSIRKYSQMSMSDDRVCTWAARNGYLKILELAHKSGYQWDKNTFKEASINGHLDCLKYLFNNGCPNDDKRSYINDHLTIALTAANGQLECLMFLHENGFDWGGMTLVQAARHGHLNCLIYAHEHGCTGLLTTNVMSQAALNGNLSCLIYAYEHGFILGNDLLYYAGMKDQVDCFIYLYDKGLPFQESDLRYIKSEEIIAYIKENPRSN